MKNSIIYKGYTLDTVNGSTYIYRGNSLAGCTHTDHEKENSAEKAKARIDSGKLKLISVK